jgi:DNA (cytosine-5)-methyltransferase 1
MSFSWGGELNGLALCAGFGGLERGLESVIDGYRTICYVEGETYPAAVLASKMEKGQILKAPVWSNVRTFEGERWRGKVDILSGGFPCQPYSQAGKQLADKDPRDLWPDFSRIIGEVRPRIIFLENVPNVVKWALPTVLKDVSKMGYDATWCVMAAADVGAPHQRKRWFLLAHANNSSEYAMREHEPFEGSSKLEKALCDSDRDGFGQYPNENSGEGVFEEGSMEGNRLENFGLDDTHSERVRRDENQYSASRRQFNVEGVRGEVPDTDGQRTQRHRVKLESREVLKRHPNPKGFKSGGSSTWWQVEPSVGRMVDGVAHWVHRIRGCGNGVVPQQAEYAFRLLNEQLRAVE